jgi:dihydroorotate dehydrogenase
MGCPAKKVCNRLAGSALMQDEALVARILQAVVKAVPIPVTLKLGQVGIVTTKMASRLPRSPKTVAFKC